MIENNIHNSTTMRTQKQRLIGIVIIVAFILLVPLIAMQFSMEVNWTVFDFVIAGLLLLGAGLSLDLVIRKINKKEHRILLFIVIAIVLLLVWIELAVGIFGSPLEGS